MDHNDKIINDIDERLAYQLHVNHRRAVARHTEKIFQGRTNIERSGHETEPLHVDILVTENTIETGIMSIGTIGLSETELSFKDGTIFPTRVELCAATLIENTLWKDALSTAAFIIMRRKRGVVQGVILENVFSEYYPSTELPHMYLTYPFIWNNAHFPQLEFNDLKINWLHGIAIHDSEKYFIYKNSAEDFEQLLLEQDVDTFDLERKTVIRN